MLNIRNGLFICLEGGEGTGKTTLAKTLKEYLEKQGYKVLLTKEPGDTPVGQSIRQLLLQSTTPISPLTEAYLFAADRAEHVEQVIIPYLEQGYIVLCDRYLGSNIAYQGCARGLGVKTIADINKNAIKQTIYPDYTLFLDIEPEKGLQRIKNNNREEDRLDKEKLSFHQKVYNGFKNNLKYYSNQVININADQSKEEVAQEAIEKINQLFNDSEVHVVLDLNTMKKDVGIFTDKIIIR